MLSVSQALVERALERPSRARRFWTAPHQPTDGSPTGQAFARAQVGKVWPRPLDRSATQLLPRRAGQPFSCGEGTRRQVQARAQTLWVAGSADAGSQLLQGPGT